MDALISLHDSMKRVLAIVSAVQPFDVHEVEKLQASDSLPLPARISRAGTPGSPQAQRPRIEDRQDQGVVLPGIWYRERKKAKGMPMTRDRSVARVLTKRLFPRQRR